MSRRRAEPKEILPHSSYYKVLSVLANFPESKEISEILTHRVKTAHIKDTHFSVNSWNASINHTFKMAMETGTLAGSTVFETKTLNEGSSKDRLKELLKDSIRETCNDIVLAHFGQKNCPTYNCKKDKVDLSKYLFDRWYLDGSNEDFCSAVDALESEMNRLATTEEFSKKSRMVLSRGAIEDIKISLRKFSAVSEDVVQEAVNEYLCERVVDS